MSTANEILLDAQAKLDLYLASLITEVETETGMDVRSVNVDKDYYCMQGDDNTALKSKISLVSRP